MHKVENINKQKALIIYFSGTGNTKGVAKAYADSLESMGYSSALRSLEAYLERQEDLASDLKDVDILAVGGPIYAGNVPDLLIHWLRTSLSKITGREAGANKRIRALTFSTSAVIDNAHGVHSLSAKLKKKGFAVVGEQAYVMPRNFYIDKYAATPLEEQRALWSKMPEQVTSHLASVLGAGTAAQVQEQVQVQSNRPAMSALGLIGIDLLADVFRIMAKGMGKDYAASDACTSCGLCVRQCPKANITIASSNTNSTANAKAASKATFGKQCMLCTRCIHQCPVNAISYKGKTIEQYRPQF
mgnify:CR=1 FL=1